MKKFSAFFVMAMCIFGFSSFVAAQEQPGQPQQGALSSSEEDFMKTAAEGGIFEVKMGRLAEKEATDDNVVEFARRMVKDHSDANEKLQALAKERVWSCRNGWIKNIRKHMKNLSLTEKGTSIRNTWI